MKLKIYKSMKKKLEEGGPPMHFGNLLTFAGGDKFI